jgi:hypothetical protein
MFVMVLFVASFDTSHGVCPSLLVATIKCPPFYLGLNPHFDVDYVHLRPLVVIIDPCSDVHHVCYGPLTPIPNSCFVVHPNLDPHHVGHVYSTIPLLLLLSMVVCCSLATTCPFASS